MTDGAGLRTPPSPPLVIVCDWIPPAFGAVGQYQLARARSAAAAGRRVVIIGLGRASERSVERAGAGELTIVRLARAAPEKTNLLKRGLWALSTNFTLLQALAAVTRAERNTEVVVTGSPPFFSYLVLLWAKYLRRRNITYRITDFYPETAFAAGKVLWLRPVMPLFYHLRRRADRIEAISECQRQRLLESEVSPTRVEVIRDTSPASFDLAVPAERPFGPGNVILLYSGNLGVAHDWRTFAEAYRRHVRRGVNRVRLWLNATGTNTEPLLAFCVAHDLPVHRSEPVPLEALPGVLLAADAHLVLLGDAFWGYVIPSKIYACLESGKPCVYVGPAQSDLHALLSGGTQHHSLRNGDIDSVEHALDVLASELAAKQPPPHSSVSAD